MGRVRADEHEVTQDVLAVLAADEDGQASIVIDDVSTEVGHVGVVIGPLGREEMDDIDAFRGCLEQGGRRGQVVDVRIAGDPRAIRGCEGGGQREPHVSVPQVHGREVHRKRRPLLAAHDLEVRALRRDVDLEHSVNVGVLGARDERVCAEVLVQARVDLVAVAEGRQISTVGCRRSHPRRLPRPIHIQQDDRQAAIGD